MFFPRNRARPFVLVAAMEHLGDTPLSCHYKAYHRLRATADSTCACFDDQHVAVCGADEVVCVSKAYALIYHALDPQGMAAFLWPAAAPTAATAAGYNKVMNACTATPGGGNALSVPSAHGNAGGSGQSQGTGGQGRGEGRVGRGNGYIQSNGRQSRSQSGEGNGGGRGGELRRPGGRCSRLGRRLGTKRRRMRVPPVPVVVLEPHRVTAMPAGVARAERPVVRDAVKVVAGAATASPSATGDKALASEGGIMVAVERFYR